jgi:AcrR family transcriptional regulator
MTSPTKKFLQSESTRRDLLDAARDLFTERGYADTPLEEVVQRAHVTRGALYHHFRDKEDLFRAVHREVAQSVHDRVWQALGQASDPWEGLLFGCRAFLDSCLDPSVQRIVLVDTPAVLGDEDLHEYDENHDLVLIRKALEGAMEAGLMPRRPAEPLAHLLLGAMHQAAIFIATAPDPKAARQSMGEAVDGLLESLRA